MYVSSSYNRLFVLNPETGELYWRYDHQYPEDLRLCCGPANRGVAIAGDLVLMATLDAQLIAFNRLTGSIVWQKEIADYKQGYSATSMPMIVKDLAIIGIAGGEFGVRGFFAAYDINTGELRWRHYTVPAKGELALKAGQGNPGKRVAHPRGPAAHTTRKRMRFTGPRATHPQTGMVMLEKVTTFVPTVFLRSTLIPVNGAGTFSSRPTMSGTMTAIIKSSW
jgi:hypothetical protein